MRKRKEIENKRKSSKKSIIKKKKLNEFSLEIPLFIRSHKEIYIITDDHS